MQLWLNTCPLFAAVAVLTHRAAAAACFIQSISPPRGPTAGGTNVVVSLQGEWPEGAVVLIDGVVHAGTLDVSSLGRVSFTTPAGLTEESVTLSSDLRGGALLFETYGKQAATHKQNSQQMLLNEIGRAHV